MHSFLYNMLISKLPDKTVEKWGGFYYKMASYLSYTPMVDLEVDIAGVTFPNPVGMPAGWIDTPDKLETVHRLGAGIPTIKTITIEPKDGNPYPRIVRKGDSMINSLGLPNKGLNWWKDNYSKPDYPTILSVKGNTIEEWRELVGKLANKAEIIELNLSCPNVGDGVMDIDSSVEIIQEISKVSSAKLFLKLSPEFSPDQNLEFVNSVQPMIAGVTAVNTKPVINSKLGNPTKQGGLSGVELYDTLKEQLTVLRSEYPTMSELPILATGGIHDPQKAVHILKTYKAIPMGLTGFLMKGSRYYYKMAKVIEKEFSTSQELNTYLGELN